MPETPLITYLRIQRAADRDVLAALRTSATSVSNELRRLQSRSGTGAIMRREQLLRSQAAINREMDVLFTRVGDVVQAASARAAQAGAETILRESESLLRTILPAADYDYMLRSAQESASRSLEALRQRVSGSSYIPLAESVYGTQNLVNGTINDIVNAALARGASAAELARDVRAYVNPATPGGARYASLRLARTEINNAFHAAQIKEAQEEPWVLAVRWHLSGSHPRPDACNDYADDVHFKNGGAGLWLPEEVPAKPHPNCLCYTTPETPDPDQFIEQYLKGDFDSYMDDVGLEADSGVETSAAPAFPAMPGDPRAAYRELERARPGGAFRYETPAALDWYKGYGSAPMNSFLRTGKAVAADGSNAPLAKVKSSVTGLDAAFRNGVKLPADTTVQRGLKNLDVDSFRPGEFVVEAGYTSTTLGSSVAERFARGTLSGQGQGEGWIVDVFLPKNTKTVIPGNQSGEEYEVLLPRNSKFKVHSVDRVNRRVRMELVP